MMKFYVSTGKPNSPHNRFVKNAHLVVAGQ